LLEGEIETSYTKADNKCVVTTDSMKNTVYGMSLAIGIITIHLRSRPCGIVFAKKSPHVLTPELFALHLALHYVTHHAHITKAFIDILSHKWSRIPVNGKPHGWAFTRDGEEKGVISVMADATGGKQNLNATVNVGLKDLLGKPAAKSTLPRSQARIDHEFDLSPEDRWVEFRRFLQG